MPNIYTEFVFNGIQHIIENKNYFNPEQIANNPETALRWGSTLALAGIASITLITGTATVVVWDLPPFQATVGTAALTFVGLGVTGIGILSNPETPDSLRLYQKITFTI